MHAYRVELEYSGPGSGGSPFKRETIVISAFGPDTPNDTLVEITTLSQPRREGRIPRFHLGDVPKEDDARYLKVCFVFCVCLISGLHPARPARSVQLLLALDTGLIGEGGGVVVMII
ncbi:hypothetical protein PAPYR_9049 [Paratrimastix pyriformis]|uniref:Uncharacterized protein n=1 Tax=Paratrimastix pyriformis TaxID=342808 RepID=A0ABQ8UC21_9EUKA|nr:hypothetical protein PAPYR_9049 [Paratrimastix pyriformis]